MCDGVNSSSKKRGSYKNSPQNARAVLQLWGRKHTQQKKKKRVDDGFFILFYPARFRGTVGSTANPTPASTHSRPQIIAHHEAHQSAGGSSFGCYTDDFIFVGSCLQKRQKYLVSYYLPPESRVLSHHHAMIYSTPYHIIPFRTMWKRTAHTYNGVINMPDQNDTFTKKSNYSYPGLGYPPPPPD